MDAILKLSLEVSLTVVGMDPNDCIYPIAFDVVEVESFVTWKWFLESLKADLQIDNTFPWTVMTVCIYFS